MPNISPRGLYGWPREGPGTSPGAASEVWVVRSDGTWCAASQVYEWCVNTANPNGAWVPVWGAADAAAMTNPLTVNAAQLGGRTTGVITVRVSWTLPSDVFANSWRVFRPDGSVVGDVANTGASTLVTTDTDPRPTPTGGQYRVAPVLGGVVGTGTLSNSLILGAAPLVTTAVMNMTDNRVDLNASTSPDTFTTVELWRVGEGAPWWTGGPWVAGTVWYDPNYPPGQPVTYRICSLVNGRRGGCTDWSPVDTKPKAPRPQWVNNQVAVTRTNTGGFAENGYFGVAVFNYWGPDAGFADSYHVQAWTPTGGGTWYDLGAGDSPGFATFDFQTGFNVSTANYNTSGYFRVATVWHGLQSDWAQFGPFNPFPPPIKPSVTTFFRSSAGAMDTGTFQGARRIAGDPLSSPTNGLVFEMYHADAPTWTDVLSYNINAAPNNVYGTTVLMRQGLAWGRIRATGPGGSTIGDQRGPV